MTDPAARRHHAAGAPVAGGHDRAGPGPGGLVVVDKPAGLTSHDVVARVRRIAGTRRVGHAGTLDPLATGVLVLGVERATKLLGHLTLTDKAYAATIRLGQDTVTVRAASSTGSPALTRAYARRPSILTAETADGTCSITPVSAASPAARSSPVTAAADDPPVGSPSASSVTVS